MFDNLPFECKRNNNYGDVSLRIYTSVCSEKIILIDVTKHTPNDSPDTVQCLTLIPSDAENVTNYGKSRKRETIPVGTVAIVEATVEYVEQNLALLIDLEFDDGSRHSLTWDMA